MNNILDDQVIDIIKKHQIKPPIDVVAIAHGLQINVYTALGTDNISGKIVKDNKFGGSSGYAIFVNKNDASTRQRFTIAHEIAHFILHKDEIGDGIVDDALYRSGLSNKKEAEANKLAAEILMPWHLINIFMNEKIKTIQALANIFQVSESAMSIRLGVPS
jgi:Zn-dependent peptidase ImmA (M78 family)